MGQGFPRELSPPFGCRWAEQPARRGFAQDRPSPVSVAAPAPRDAVTDTFARSSGVARPPLRRSLRGHLVSTAQELRVRNRGLGSGTGRSSFAAR